MYPSQRSLWVDRLYVFMSITCFLQDVLSSNLFPLLLVFVYPAWHDWFIIMIFIWWLSYRYEIRIWLYWDINPIQIIPWVMSWPIEVGIPIEMTWPLPDIEVLCSPRARRAKFGGKKGQIPWEKAWVRHSSQWVTTHLDFVACHSSLILLYDQIHVLCGSPVLWNHIQTSDVLSLFRQKPSSNLSDRVDTNRSLFY